MVVQLVHGGQRGGLEPEVSGLKISAFNYSTSLPSVTLYVERFHSHDQRSYWFTETKDFFFA